MISSGMGFVGIVLMLSAVAVSCAAEATARGKIGVNPFVGLRVGYVTHSSGAWLAGHRAARPLLHTAGAVLAASGVLLLVLPGMSDEDGGLVVIAACLAVLGIVIAAAVKANRAAELTVVSSVDAQPRTNNANRTS